MSSGHFAGLEMQVYGGEEVGKSCTGEVMTTWSLHSKSTTRIVMEEAELSPEGQTCVHLPLCVCI